MFYYNKQIDVQVINRVYPLPFTWHISQIIIDYLSPIVIAWDLNQSKVVESCLASNHNHEP
jgi:hypothetical protein